MLQALSNRIVVLGTGGTIAGLGGDLGYRAGAVGIDALVQGIGGPRDPAVETESILQIDSKDLDFAGWRRIVDAVVRHLDRAEVRGIVVTHGTDTLEETACLLQRLLAPRKPVVLTGAMRPADSRASDGPQNLADALAVAADATSSGVTVVFGGRIFDALEVRKIDPFRLDAFGAGEGGPLGVVEGGRVRWFRRSPDAAALGADGWPVDPADWPVVEIVAAHVGARAATVDALVDGGVDGLVVATTGNGTVSVALEPALRRARARGVVVWRASRCLGGAIVESNDEAPPDFPSAGAATPVRARIELMLAIARARRLGGDVTPPV